MKKTLMFGLLVMAMAGSLVFVGCGTTTSTSSGSASISGTITLPGIAGRLWVGASTDNTAMATTGWVEVTPTVSASDATYNYTLPITTAGTYYVFATLSVGTTEVRSMPVTGDRVGEFSDGYFPAGMGQTPSGTPEGIVIGSGTNATGKNFSLLTTWN